MKGSRPDILVLQCPKPPQQTAEESPKNKLSARGTPISGGRRGGSGGRGGGGGGRGGGGDGGGGGWADRGMV